MPDEDKHNEGIHTDSLWVYAMKWLENPSISISGGSIREGIVIIVMCSLWCLPAGGHDSFDVVSVRRTPRLA
jgi:hypothetical protein